MAHYIILRGSVIALMMLCFIEALGQKCYIYNISDQYFSTVVLELDSAGHYELSVEPKTIQNGSQFLLSAGRYHIDADKLCLVDQSSGYKIGFKYSDESLLVIQGYSFLLGSRFNTCRRSRYRAMRLAHTVRKNPDQDTLEHYAKIELLPPRNLQECSLDNCELQPEPKLSEGTYAIYGFLPHVEYWEGMWIVFSNGVYSAYIGRSLLAKGTYRQEDGNMILQDKILDTLFRFKVISDSCICATSFIGDIMGRNGRLLKQ